MPRSSYSAEFKAKIVLEVLQGEKELNVIAAEQGINPNMIRNWKKEFISNASQVFDEKKQVKEAHRKEVALKKEKEQMLRTIGQLTLERDFIQGAFRDCGIPVPKFPQD